ncbi:MAG: O-antigen ligase family protein, partial [Selenomonadaceae bacterium]
MIVTLDRWIGWLLLAAAVLLGSWRTGANIVISIAFLLAVIRIIGSFSEIKWDINPGLLKAAGIYFFVIGATSIFSEDIRTSLLAGQEVFRYILIFFVFWPFVRQPQVQNKILYCFAAGIGIGGCIIVLANLIPALHNHARTGLLGIMNYGGAAAILLPGTTALALLEEDRRIKRWLSAAIFFGGMGLLYNGTRGAWIAAGVAMILTIALFWRPRIKHVLLLGGVLLIVGGVVSQSAFLSQRIKSTDRQDSSIVLRLGMWKLGLESWENHKLAGSGLGRAPTYTYQP